MGLESKINLPSAQGAAFDSHADELDARCTPGTREDLLCQIKEWVETHRENAYSGCVAWLALGNLQYLELLLSL